METFKQFEKDIIDPNTEMHYAMLSSFQHTKFPHSHDFFEFFLLLEGTQLLEINEHTLTIEPNTLLLIRPNDVHSRKYIHPGLHINIAFPSKIAQSMFAYLGSGYPTKQLLTSSLPPYRLLSPTESKRIQSKLQELYAVQIKDKESQKTMLRTIIFDIFVHHFSRCFSTNQSGDHWFDLLLEEMEHPENLISGLPAMISISQKTHEHLCRVFKQKLNITPTKYVNDLRLNYAANFLIRSDLEIIDICMNSGFDNLSHFYHLFKKKYGMSPKNFRQLKDTTRFSL